MTNPVKKALLKIKIAYWKRFSPSRYVAYRAGKLLEDVREFARRAENAITCAAAASVSAAAELDANIEKTAQNGMHADIVLLDEYPRAET